jgi:putative hemolysin
MMIRILALCVFSAFLLLAGCIGPGGLPNNTHMPNPASVYCEEHGGVLEIRTDGSGGQYGVCKLAGGVECDEWKFYNGECNATSPTYCGTTADCACGVHKTTRQCFYGNKDYVDVSQQCPDFCNGIAAHLEIVCAQHNCVQVRAVRNFEECAALNDSAIMESYPRQCRTADGRSFTEDINEDCASHTVEECNAPCVVCPPCAECSSIGCQSQQFCENIGFNSTWYEETQGGTGETCEDLCGDGVCQEVVCMAIGCPCSETAESCPGDCGS